MSKTFVVKVSTFDEKVTKLIAAKDLATLKEKGKLKRN